MNKKYMYLVLLLSVGIVAMAVLLMNNKGVFNNLQAAVIKATATNKDDSMNAVPESNSQPIANCGPKSEPSIKVESPNGGETYNHGIAINITWSTCNIPTTDMIYLSAVEYTQNGVMAGNNNYTVLAVSTPNDGIQSVTLPTLPLLSAQKFYRILIQHIGTTHIDRSDSNFKITKKPQALSTSRAPITTKYTFKPIILGSEGETTGGNQNKENYREITVPETTDVVRISMVGGGGGGGAGEDGSTNQPGDGSGGGGSGAYSTYEFIVTPPGVQNTGSKIKNGDKLYFIVGIKGGANWSGSARNCRANGEPLGEQVGFSILPETIPLVVCNVESVNNRKGGTATGSYVYRDNKKLLLFAGGGTGGEIAYQVNSDGQWQIRGGGNGGSRAQLGSSAYHNGISVDGKKGGNGGLAGGQGGNEFGGGGGGGGAIKGIVPSNQNGAAGTSAGHGNNGIGSIGTISNTFTSSLVTNLTTPFTITLGQSSGGNGGKGGRNRNASLSNAWWADSGAKGLIASGYGAGGGGGGGGGKYDFIQENTTNEGSTDGGDGGNGSDGIILFEFIDYQ